MKNVIIIGASGHARVVADIVTGFGDKLLGFLDSGKAVGTSIIESYRVIGRVEDAPLYKDCAFIIAIGDNNTRESISKLDLCWYTAIHKGAVIGLGVQIGEGSVVMAGAVINSGAVVGRHCIINTASVVEHDNVIKDFAHISPCAVLGGSVTVGRKTHVAIGAVVRNNIKIAPDSIIGAGAVVVSDITVPGIYLGLPAKRKNEK